MNCMVSLRCLVKGKARYILIHPDITADLLRLGDDQQSLRMTSDVPILIGPDRAAGAGARALAPSLGATRPRKAEGCDEACCCSSIRWSNDTIHTFAWTALKASPNAHLWWEIGKPKSCKYGTPPSWLHVELPILVAGGLPRHDEDSESKTKTLVGESTIKFWRV